MIKRVVATDAALALIDLLKRKHGPIIFHQSGGCCDGSAPMCYPVGDLIIGDQDILLGNIGGAPFYEIGENTPDFSHGMNRQCLCFSLIQFVINK